MSKAFTKESDDTPDIPLLPPRATLPPGVKNYITKDGAEKIQQELASLQEQRPALVSDDSPASQERLARLDLRARQLQEILATVEVVEPATAEPDSVKFGAFVTVGNRAGEVSTYRIVGLDEVDLDRDWISWQSPLARALLNKQEGEEVKFRSPAGEQHLKIVKVEYQIPA